MFSISTDIGIDIGATPVMGGGAKMRSWVTFLLPILYEKHVHLNIVNNKIVHKMPAFDVTRYLSEEITSENAISSYGGSQN